MIRWLTKALEDGNSQSEITTRTRPFCHIFIFRGSVVIRIILPLFLEHQTIPRGSAVGVGM